MEKEKKGNGPTNAGTCTSVVWARRGADRKALPRRISSSCDCTQQSDWAGLFFMSAIRLSAIILLFLLSSSQSSVSLSYFNFAVPTIQYASVWENIRE